MASFYAICGIIPSTFSAAPWAMDDLELGLLYLPLTLGSVLATFSVGPLMNSKYRYYARRRAGLPRVRGVRTVQLNSVIFPIDRVRLEPGIPFLILAVVSVLGWGWAIRYRESAYMVSGLRRIPAIPCAVLFFFAVGMIGFTGAVNALIVDLSAAPQDQVCMAVAYSHMLAYLLSAGINAAIIPMSARMGEGWAYTVLGGLMGLTVPFLVKLKNNGVRWRIEARWKRDKELRERTGVRLTNAPLSRPGGLATDQRVSAV